MLLTAHFSFEELTQTSNAPLQAANRNLTPEQRQKLQDLAVHCELIRALVGNAPVRIHSGYRSPALNGNTLGASSTSQHPKCEAVDFDVPGQSIEQTFDILHQAAKAGKFKFGQLIVEEANRGYAAVEWVHCSVIGTLDPAKVGEVMRMVAGADGIPHYELVEKLDFSPS